MRNIKEKIAKIEAVEKQIDKLVALADTTEAINNVACLFFEANGNSHGHVAVDPELFVTALKGQIIILENSISADLQFVQAVELMLTKE